VSSNTSTRPMQYHDTRCFIGANAHGAGGSRNFEGVMDEFKLYNRVLSDAEILEKYQEVVT